MQSTENNLDNLSQRHHQTFYTEHSYKQVLFYTLPMNYSWLEKQGSGIQH